MRDRDWCVAASTFVLLAVLVAGVGVVTAQEAPAPAEEACRYTLQQERARGDRLTEQLVRTGRQYAALAEAVGAIRTAEDREAAIAGALALLPDDDQ